MEELFLCLSNLENKKDFLKLGVKEEKVILGDHIQSDSEYTNFTQKYLGAVIPYLEDYNACYLFNADLMYPAMRTGMKNTGFYYSQMIIWIKNQPVMSRKDYLSQYEYLSKLGESHGSNLLDFFK